MDMKWLIGGGIVIAIIVLLFSGTGGTNSLAGEQCQIELQQTYTSFSGNLEVVDKGDGNYELPIDSSDLNSANATNISIVLNNARVDDCQASGNTMPKRIFYDVKVYDTYENVNDDTDTVTYHRLERDVQDGYKVTIDGTAYAVKNPVNDMTDGSSNGQATIIFEVPNYTDLDKFTTSAKGSLKLATVTVEGKTTDLVYYKG